MTLPTNNAFLIENFFGKILKYISRLYDIREQREQNESEYLRLDQFSEKACH